MSDQPYACDPNHGRYDDDMTPTYRIKPLVWGRVDDNFSRANSIFGLYTAHRNGPNGRWHVNTGSKTHASLAGAKAAVEEYYQEQLLTALEPVT